MTAPPRRPGRWSRAVVAAAGRGLLVVWLIALLAWPEWHRLDPPRETWPGAGTFHKRWFRSPRPWPESGWLHGRRVGWFRAGCGSGHGRGRDPGGAHGQGGGPDVDRDAERDVIAMQRLIRDASLRVPVVR